MRARAHAAALGCALFTCGCQLIAGVTYLESTPTPATPTDDEGGTVDAAGMPGLGETGADVAHSDATSDAGGDSGHPEPGSDATVDDADGAPDAPSDAPLGDASDAELDVPLPDDAGEYLPPPPATGPWSPADVGMTGGSVNALAASPTDGNVVYACLPAGLYKTIDEGAHWTAMTMAPLPAYCNLVRFAPSSGEIVYVVARTFTSDASVSRTTDGGKTWSIADVADDITEIEVDPINPDVVYIAASSGLRRSHDGGETFDETLTNAPEGITNFVLRNSQELYAAAAMGLYRSTDAGQSFTMIPALCDGMPDGQFAVEADGSNVFYGCAWGHDDAGIRVTSDGIHWSQTLSAQVLPVAAPGVPGLVFGFANISNDIYRSTNHGQSWIGPENPSADFFNPILDRKGNVFTGFEEDLTFSSDDGNTFIDRSTGVHGRQIDSVYVDPSNSSTLYALSNSMPIHKSTDAGKTWKVAGASAPWSSTLAFDATQPNTLYTAYNLFYKSTDGGANWTSLGTPAGLSAYSTATDKAHPGTIYVADTVGKLAKSINSGVTFNVLPPSVDPGAASIMTVHPVDGTLYIKSGSNYRSIDGGQTLTKLPSGAMIGIAISDVKVVYVAGFDGIYRSADHGATFVRTSTTVASAIAVDPTNADHVFIYANTFLESTDGAQTFIPHGQSLPTVAPEFFIGGTSMALDPKTPTTVYLAPGSNGLWKSTTAGH
jgi:photosystem II stability/assembly factor-like uncharacterized protein